MGLQSLSWANDSRLVKSTLPTKESTASLKVARPAKAARKEKFQPAESLSPPAQQSGSRLAFRWATDPVFAKGRDSSPAFPPVVAPQFRSVAGSRCRLMGALLLSAAWFSRPDSRRAPRQASQQ